MVCEMTAGESLTIARALGRPVLQAVDALLRELNALGQAPAAMWHSFLQALHDGAGADVMASPLGISWRLLARCKETEMETMTRMRATVDAQVRAFQGIGACIEYAGIRLHTDNPDRVIPFVDQLLFFLRGRCARRARSPFARAEV